jgi:hypothetical protein
MLATVLALGAVGLGIVFVVVRAAMKRSRHESHGRPAGTSVNGGQG